MPRLIHGQMAEGNNLPLLALPLFPKLLVVIEYRMPTYISIVIKIKGDLTDVVWLQRTNQP